MFESFLARHLGRVPSFSSPEINLLGILFSAIQLMFTYFSFYGSLIDSHQDFFAEVCLPLYLRDTQGIVGRRSLAYGCVVDKLFIN